MWKRKAICQFWLTALNLGIVNKGAFLSECPGRLLNGSFYLYSKTDI
jgi:hypothetical protein